MNLRISCCLLLSLFLYACSAAPAPPQREPDPDAAKEEINRVVETFFAAADNHSLTTLESLLHPDFRIVVTRPDMGPQTVDKAEYIALMATGLIGGKPRQIENIATRVSGDRAVSHVKLEGAHASFDAMQTFVREHEKWTLIHSLIQYDPKT